MLIRKAIRFLCWLLMVNGLFAMGLVVYNQQMFYLPEYGIDFWWALGESFIAMPENILCIALGIISFVLLITKVGFVGKPSEIKD